MVGIFKMNKAKEENKIIQNFTICNQNLTVTSLCKLSLSVSICPHSLNPHLASKPSQSLSPPHLDSHTHEPIYIHVVQSQCVQNKSHHAR